MAFRQSVTAHGPRGGLPREDLERRVQEGATLAEIAEILGRSKTTIRYWLRRYGLRTTNKRGRRPSEQARAAKAASLTEVVMACDKHGQTSFVIDGRGYYRCRRCRSAAVVRRRQKVKEILVREAGGCRQRCGYSSSMRALHFHHLDPTEKRMEINAKGIPLALDALRMEAQKCMRYTATAMQKFTDASLEKEGRYAQAQASLECTVSASKVAST